MSSSCVAVLLLSYTAAAVAQFYGSLGGYACSQPVLYRQCQCPSLCGSYGSVPNGYSGGYPGGYTGGYILLYDSGYGGGFGGGYGAPPRRHKKRRHHKKKKFRFEIDEGPEEESPSEEPPSEEESPAPESAERRPPPSEPEEKPSKSKHSWEDEDEWEKKFVNKEDKSKGKEGEGKKSKETEGGPEDLPEIEDEEMVPAKSRSELANTDKMTPATAPAVNARSRASPSGDAGGRGAPVSVDNSGNGGQVQPIAAAASSNPGGETGSVEDNGDIRPPGLGGARVRTASGSGAGGGGSSGLAGLGLGSGGLFGISSGIGVTAPGVGPIGVGSGLGVGR